MLPKVQGSLDISVARPELHSRSGIRCSSFVPLPLHVDARPFSDTCRAGMGRLDLRPRRVHDAASLFMDVTRRKTLPVWYQTITDTPPSQTLVRTQPVPHNSTTTVDTSARPRKYRKPSKMFLPVSLRYEDDRLRHEFFSDHPWELARPRMILEDDGRDHRKWDWSKSYETGRPVNGER